MVGTELHLRRGGDRTPAPLPSGGFLYAAERQYGHWAILQPLYKALGQIYKAAMTFYQANKKTKEGSLLDPSTFFQYRRRHSQFERFWASTKNGRRRRTVEGYLRKFIDGLTEVDVGGV